ncbi:MAG TPA: SDR family oxidoreductase [Thermoanaerobaculia bacterium]|jgi:dTDP-4-dehydrorhamnose reductase
MLVLILGGGGMLGHQVWAAARARFDARVAVRRRPESPLFDDERVIDGFDAGDFDGVRRVVERVRPDAVINCVGIVKQIEADDADMLAINAEFPHVLAGIAPRVIQISTDCVFSGAHAVRPYRETDVPDPVDIYGRSKLLGELDAPHVTLRTSIVGRELGTSHGLLEWFLGRGAQRAPVHGYTRAFFSGISTPVLARILCHVAENPLQGLYHVAGEAISKYDLLMLLNEAFDARISIEPDDSVVLDRTLDGARFAAATGIAIPPWREMARELAR